MRRFLIQIPVISFVLIGCASNQSAPGSLSSNQTGVNAAGSDHGIGNSVLERAVMALPSEAVADIPLSERAVFLKHLAEDGSANPRLDVSNGFLEFYTDGEVPFHASSMLYMKVFPRKEGGAIVFCHMPKPHADTLPPRPGQTCFFEERDGKWVDVTRAMLPKGIDPLWLFVHGRHSLVLQAGPYKIWKKPDGKEVCGGDGTRLKDLVWDGCSFRVRTAKSKVFDYND